MPRKSHTDGLRALARLLGYPPIAQDRLPGFELAVVYSRVGAEEMVVKVSCPRCNQRATYTIQRHGAAYTPSMYQPIHSCGDGVFAMSPVYLGSAFTSWETASP